MRLFYILTFILLSTTAAFSQDRSASVTSRDMFSVAKFYPNPASSYINFELQLSNSKDLNFQVYNFLGKKVFETIPTNEKITINLNDFFRGVYIFQLRDRMGKVVDTGKFQVSK